ncbi:piggyBac transposable element-derived 4-like protein [Labeo rohita]|uniref:PiggyBac transposable element-derived 4-like protein n=1 Tax=Labeo rohita TaxID=84645 RepID=A0A498L6N5_LABRO|nr:piggyBac transposable element-derived 4-like protein [Labeo rohita]RXN22020.1 piggyBac transposable element-derived 4-like protein [Labeo rohita]
MLAVKCHDKRDVHMQTTIYSAEMSPSGKTDHITGDEKIKPQCVLDYNKKMGAVDKVDMMDSFVGCTRKTLKWYKKLFFHFVYLAVPLADSKVLVSKKAYQRLNRARMSIFAQELAVLVSSEETLQESTLQEKSQPVTH